MNSRITKMKQDIFDKKHHEHRQVIDPNLFTSFTAQMSAEGLGDEQRAARRLAFALSMEQPFVRPDDKIVFMRTVKSLPALFTAEEWQRVQAGHYIHEQGRVCNVSPDYASTIRCGLSARRSETGERLARLEDQDGREFLQAVIDSIDAVLELGKRYAEAAEVCGNNEAAAILRRVPAEGAQTFHEALQAFRILHFTLWVSGNYHNTIGRFDQYMWPYLADDLADGRLDLDQAFELLEEFFLSFNLDSDLYPGMQQGDNGQSMVLGGVDLSGAEASNPLTELCLKASLDLALIDPKINLRVSSATPLAWYELGSRLTRQGLGFPQYSNDDVVIPGLIRLGYQPEDARNYVVAACWEFIVPGKGMDIPNIGALSFAHVVDTVVREQLEYLADFESLLVAVDREIEQQVKDETARFSQLFFEPAPFLSLLMDGCIARARDIAQGGIYNNFGLHGTGLATAADSLAAIRQAVFNDRLCSATEMLQALDSDFAGFEELQNRLKFDMPKMGNDDDRVDAIACRLLETFSHSLTGLVNERGGCYRAGTGSAMYYAWHAKTLGATADGRKRGEFLSANFAPSLNVRLKGPLSILRSFAKPNLLEAINGGPLTIEIHDSVFRNDESITKVAWLVKTYMGLGGHQLQLNAVNRDRLLQARENPHLHRNLIVRVWGWSGYFVELDPVYQDQIIQRVELTF